MLKRKDVKELTLLVVLSGIFLITFNKIWFLFWELIAYIGGLL